MSKERALAAIHASITPELSIPSSPTMSSPLSSTPHSRTSTITSTSCSRANISLNRQMKIGKYYLERTIGKGNFAVVKLATHCDTHQKVLEMKKHIFPVIQSIFPCRSQLKSSINPVLNPMITKNSNEKSP